MSEQVDTRGTDRERLAALWAGTEAGLWDLDAATRELHVSPRWRAIAGLPEQPGAELELDFWLDLVHPHDQKELRRAIEAHLAGRTPELACEFRLHHADGSWRHVRCRGR